MSNIHDHLDAVDEAVFETLGDRCQFQGREFFAIFEKPWEGGELGQWRTGLTEPTLQVRDSQMTGIARNSEVTVDKQGVFTVADIQPQGDHTTVLILRKDRQCITS